MATSTGTVTLTAQQQEALHTLLNSPKQVQTLGGYAGTGKTTVISTLLQKLRDKGKHYRSCAFTGKAAEVLRRKGVPAKTIHSTIYEPNEVTKYDYNGNPYTEVEFLKVPAAQLRCDGFVIDEASMVSEELYNDLTSYGIPCIFVGDHGQLEPVGSKFNLMANPDVRLETIHRNAGDIALFAQHLRLGNSSHTFKPSRTGLGHSVRFVSMEDFSSGMVPDPDQIICAYNATRVNLNRMYRSILSFPEDVPVVGDRIMCLRNSSEHHIYNGQQGVISEIIPQRRLIAFTTDHGTVRVLYDPNQFNNENPPKYGAGYSIEVPFDYCYAVTCHKAQGDEWDSVLVFEQVCGGWEHSRWAYTAASRAKESLYWMAHE